MYLFEVFDCLYSPTGNETQLTQNFGHLVSKVLPVILGKGSLFLLVVVLTSLIS